VDTGYLLWTHSYTNIRSDVMSSRTKWPRGQNFGLSLKRFCLGLEALASASASTFGLGLASILLSYHVIGHLSGKNGVKFGNLLIFPAIILNCMLLIIMCYFFHNYFWPWPQPPEIGLVALVSASRFWPRLTSLNIRTY